MKKLKKESISDLQKRSYKIYGLPNDRFYSLSDLLSNLQRFTMRALKGIRKKDVKKMNTNLLVAISWLMAISNRLHIDVEKVLWKRFPYVCSYCGFCPCICREIKSDRKKVTRGKKSLKPENISDFQKMFESIYPPDSRTLADAGIHLAEEIGELSEAIHSYQGEHLKKQFSNIENEIADYVSCFFGLANSSKINLEKEIKEKYENNCHVCHNAPCTCSYRLIANFKS